MAAKPTTHVLEYAPSPRLRWPPLFRTTLAFLAICGVFANSWLIADSVRSVRFGAEAYRNLSLNPKAYGRLIAPETIASLRAPYWLWMANAAALIAATAGIILALYLLGAVVRLRRTPEMAVRQFEHYRRFQIRAAAVAGIAALWAGFANLHLLVAASRHMPVGSESTVLFWPLMLFFGGLIPCEWIGNALARRHSAG